MTQRIYVLAGVNGAGKSSVVGSRIRKGGMDYFNPDEASAAIRTETGCSLEEANARAWNEGKERLEHAIRERTDFAFETTLGANTLPMLLRQAAEERFEVRAWFIGLASVEQHMARVRARVASGGHDIPEEKIRERWDASRRNLILLLPRLRELRVFDNSAERAPMRLLLHWNAGAVAAIGDLQQTPDWAKPIVAAALHLTRRS